MTMLGIELREEDDMTAVTAGGVMEYVVVALLAIGGVWAAVHGARLLVRAVRRADDPASSLRAVRGIRGLVIGVAAWALAAGLLLEQTWLLVFGAVFLAEELYETGVLVLVLRMADDATSGAR
ncbi:MAG: hypothetical protein DMD84_26290 [Candidatus Rokuibacteriota bacterium]|nr:MAG: hypothetical protein DMD84_26290 [Candidatus Rokubacteria bacterium]